MKVLDPLAFAIAACRVVAPEGVEVVASADVDAAERMPLAVVQTTSPSSVRNGPIAAAVNLVISVVVYDDGPDDARASEVSRAMFAGLVDAWRNHTPIAHGQFVRIGNDSQLPSRFPARLEADNVHRWDFTIRAVVRPL